MEFGVPAGDLLNQPEVLSQFKKMGGFTVYGPVACCTCVS